MSALGEKLISAAKQMQSDTEPYIRSDDGATMVALSPGVYVNKACRL